MNEEELNRADALGRYAIIDTPPEPDFDRITKMTASIFHHPVCTLALADRDRFWFKSKHGVAGTEMPRHMAFCEETIQGNGVFVVSDALADPRFVNAPVVAGPPHFRFYAGAPLIAPSGVRIGSLCVLNTEQQVDFSANDRSILLDLASTVVDLMESRARQIALSECTREIAHLASHDALTGLPNRRRLTEFMSAVHAEQSIALLYLDLDGFKKVNDSLGHASGDVLLQQVADRLLSVLPLGAHAVRLGGDEFAVLLNGGDDVAHEAEVLARRLVIELGLPYDLDGAVVEIGVSIGVAIAFGPNELTSLRKADAALYAAKSHGGSCYCFSGDTSYPVKQAG